MNLARMVDCLDPDLCDRIINTSWEFTRSTVLNGGSSVVDPIRSNSGASLVGGMEHMAHEQINKALSKWSERIKSEYPEEIVECLYLPGVRTAFDTWRETIGILKYEPGQAYSWHVDQPAEMSHTGDCQATSRCVSVVVYLNDDFKGGETEMLGRKYRPKKGKALIFPSNWNYPHRACPVEEGTKYALVTWYHSSN